MKMTKFENIGKKWHWRIAVGPRPYISFPSSLPCGSSPCISDRIGGKMDRPSTTPENPSSEEIQEGGTTTTTPGVAGEVKWSLMRVKEKLMAKIAAARGPAEEMVKEAQGVTRDALHRIKTHIVDYISSPDHQHQKMVDDGEKEAMDVSGGQSEKQQQKSKESYMSPASSLSLMRNALRSRM